MKYKLEVETPSFRSLNDIVNALIEELDAPCFIMSVGETKHVTTHAKLERVE